MSEYKRGVRHGKGNTYKPRIGPIRQALGFFSTSEYKADRAYDRGWKQGKKKK